MKLTVTATQLGLTPHQKLAFENLLKQVKPTCIIHGGCIGGDWDCDGVAARLGITRYVYPSNITVKSVPREMYDKYHPGSQVVFAAEPAPPLDRNKTMVKIGDALCALPKEATETVRSGTWSTVRYARKINKSVTIIYFERGV